MAGSTPPALAFDRKDATGLASLVLLAVSTAWLGGSGAFALLAHLLGHGGATFAAVTMGFDAVIGVLWLIQAALWLLLRWDAQEVRREPVAHGPDEASAKRWG